MEPPYLSETLLAPRLAAIHEQMRELAIGMRLVGELDAAKYADRLAAEVSEMLGQVCAIPASDRRRRHLRAVDGGR